jgi:signal transduction histidine kinase
LAFWLEDNGKGFDVQQATAAVSANQGLGLITMQERARMLGGNLEIRSLEGQGTRISLTLALP